MAKKQNYFTGGGEDATTIGRQLLLNRNAEMQDLEVLAPGFENMTRKVVIVKPLQAYQLFRELIRFYAVTNIIKWIEGENITAFDEFSGRLPHNCERLSWINVGGQLMPKKNVQELIAGIVGGLMSGWEGVHQFMRNRVAGTKMISCYTPLRAWRK